MNSQNQPRKYRRHRILRDFGLMSKQDFDNIIRRYNPNDIEVLFADIKKFYNSPESKNFDVVFITLIHPVITQNLPLFIIKNESDIENIHKKYSEFDKVGYAEVYFSPFRTSDSVCGRIEFVFDELFPRIAPINLELTCGASCREINQYPNIAQAYMSFATSDKSFPFIHKETIISNPDRNYIKDCSKNILKQIPGYYKKLLDLAIIFHSIGARGVSFDFQYTNDYLFFWDFDTDDDNKILRILELNNI